MAGIKTDQRAGGGENGAQERVGYGGDVDDDIMADALGDVDAVSEVPNTQREEPVQENYGYDDNYAAGYDDNYNTDYQNADYTEYANADYSEAEYGNGQYDEYADQYANAATGNQNEEDDEEDDDIYATNNTSYTIEL
jgi:hypothetical protein